MYRVQHTPSDDAPFPAGNGEAPPIISLRGVTRRFRSGAGEVVTILDGVDLDIEAGSLTVIRGESGSGKTTLLRILGMLDADFDGSYTLGGMQVDGQPDWRLDEMRAENLGFIFQEGRLFDHISLRDNISIPLKLLTRMDAGERRERCDALLARVFRPDELEKGIPDHLPASVSGGQKQRASITRAVVGRPCIILADEPTASLHGELKAEIVRQLHELRNLGHTVIVVSHDSVFYGAGRQLEIIDGRIRELDAGKGAESAPGPAAPAETVALHARPPREGGQLLWGWRPRAPFSILFDQAWRETFLRPIFLFLILTSLIVGVCQVGVFGSVILGTDAFVAQKVTEGSRLNRLEIQPRRADLAAADRFPVRAELPGWPNVSDVVPRRSTTQTLRPLDGDPVPFAALGLLPGDPEYRLLHFVAGGPFSEAHDQLEVILTASILGQFFDIAGMQAGEADFDSFIGRTVEVLVPRFAAGGQPLGTHSALLKVRGIILHGEGGRQIYMPNTTQLVFDGIKRDRENRAEFPVTADGAAWSDLSAARAIADFPWEDRLHIYSSEIRDIIPAYTRLARLGYAPKSDIWNYKWALDIQDTAWRIFMPLLGLIVIAVSMTVFANIFTSAKLRETELALWRVLGMRRGDIVFVQVMGTVMSITLGTLLGLLAGELMVSYIRDTLRERAQEVEVGREAQNFDSIFADVWSFAWPVMIGAIIIGVVAALYPAFRASNVAPAKVLQS